jgi:hypothetical protein
MKKEKKQDKKKSINVVVKNNSIIIPAEEMKTSEILDEFNKLPEDEWDYRFMELEGELDKRHPFEYLYRRIDDMQLEINRLNRLLKHHHADGKILYEE